VFQLFMLYLCYT